MENLIEYLLNDIEILEKYEAIDKVNPYPFNHGMKHIKNVVKLVDKIAPLFSLSNRQVEILKTCEILHDLGQVDGREKHGYKASIFAKSYLEKLNHFTDTELQEIVSAINTHDEHHDYSKLENDYSWFVNFIDKMDFASNRLEDNYEKEFGYIEYNDINQINFEKVDNNFIIKLETIENPKIISAERLLARNFFSKVVKTSLKFCEHFGLNLTITLDNKSINLSLANLNE